MRLAIVTWTILLKSSRVHWVPQSAMMMKGMPCTVRTYINRLLTVSAWISGRFHKRWCIKRISQRWSGIDISGIQKSAPIFYHGWFEWSGEKCGFLTELADAAIIEDQFPPPYVCVLQYEAITWPLAPAVELSFHLDAQCGGPLAIFLPLTRGRGCGCSL